jgi:hypothetical protein
MDLCTFLSHIQESYIVVGFVVNIYDAINMDIDLFFSSSQIQKYKNAITVTYKYKDYVSKENKPPGLNVSQRTGQQEKVFTYPEIQRGLAYRCRLKGIQPKHGATNAEKELLHYRAKKDMKYIIDRTNGWVLCTISKMDTYNRLLIDLLDPGLYPKYHFSYIQILLHKYPVIFTKYSSSTNKMNKKDNIIDDNSEIANIFPEHKKLETYSEGEVVKILTRQRQDIKLIDTLSS